MLIKINKVDEIYYRKKKNVKYLHFNITSTMIKIKIVI